MTYQYNGKSYILQDRLYYRVTEESVIVDKNMLRTQEPVLPEQPVSVPILPVLPEPVLPEPVLPEPETVLPEPETVLPEPETVLPEQIMIKKKR